MHFGAFTKVNSKNGCQRSKMKDLRQGRDGKKDSGKSAKNLETIVFQHLSAVVSGKAQKYSRVGAREFVSFENFDKLSSDNNGGDRLTQLLCLHAIVAFKVLLKRLYLSTICPF